MSDPIAYCEFEDICPSKISEEKMAQLTSDDASTIDIDVVNDIITSVSAEIDSYCGKRYTVPFDPVPPEVKSCAIKKVTYGIYEHRIQESGGEIAKSIRDMQTDATAWLLNIAKGIVVIDGAVKPAVNIEQTGGAFHANKKVFSSHSLKNL